ncbi:LOW QUALITY PROTEIN: protein cereblon [Corythoichthys intestinalis]|uniref:LOW QUALITY PROTEIN: protein cereblon n=1 Tax=Corythoichthys intestinalis TaxID=161448 RepID=UPI0025A5607C|nr:LOW QUALITY PROTEIN: protein cereblon [Corythoichthys intestinalis]
MEKISCLFLLMSALYRPTAACAANAAGKTTSTDTLILCRACGHELASGADTIPTVHSRMALAGRNDTLPGGRRVHVQMFENPQGLQFEVVTFRRADVDKRWPAEKHFSWFPGFSWTVATCPRCRAHLGWAFQPSSWPTTISSSLFESSEQTFLALIVDRLLREDFASSLLITPKSFIS